MARTFGTCGEITIYVDGIAPITSVFVPVSVDRSNIMTTYDSTADYIALPLSPTTEISRNIMGGAEVWGVAHTDINAAADKWNAFIHFDSISGLIWMIATDTGTTEDTHYLATIAIADGAIVQIGNFQSDNFTSDVQGASSRAAENSGDFTIIHSGRKFVLTSSGALSASDFWAPTGVTGSVGNIVSGLLDPTGKYVIQSITDDGITIDTCNGDAGSGGGITVAMVAPLQLTDGAGGSFRMWGPNLCLLRMNTAVVTITCQRYYNKVSVFNYINSVLGL